MIDKSKWYQMDILKILDGVKGKVLDAAHFELLQHAYQLQENNVLQLKTNNLAFKESNELLKEKLKKHEEKIEQLEGELSSVKKALRKQNDDDSEKVIKLSENATKVMSKIINEDVTHFYQNAIIDVMDISRISVEAALDELMDYGLIEAYSARKGYGIHYHLTSKAKKAIG
ncbi:hypothetical protein [Lelliottia sp. JS-SCA-14]|uniref:hypothetical protein n=1 Tax=Lelliottia sp. JS-SCA-14 TaxID=3110110 RepID=UPI002D770937|nr:hypothetical protein [Lelliottia sp. JS-SCA-14]